MRELDERWRMWQIAWGVWVSIASSANDSVGGYISPILKDAPYGYSQKRLALLDALVSAMANFMALTTGWVFDRFGPQWCLRIGALCVFVGQGLLTLMLWDAVPLSFGLLMVARSAASFAGTFYESGSFISNIAVFAKDKGSVLIVEEALGGAIFAAWYSGFFEKSAKSLLIFTTVAVPCVGVLASLVLRKPVMPERCMPWHGHRRFATAYAIVGVTICFFIAVDFAQNFTELSQHVHIFIATFGVAATLAYALLPLAQHGTPFLDEAAADNLSFVDGGLAEDAERRDTLDETGLVEATLNDVAVSTEPTGVTLREALTGPDFYLMILLSVAQWGVADMIKQNSPQIYRALNDGTLDKNRNAVYISIMSIFNSMSRIAVALLDMKVKDKTALVIVGPVLITLAVALSLFLPVDALIVVFALNSFGRTWTWGARCLAAKQLFSGQHFGRIWNALYMLGCSWQGATFSLGLFAPTYDDKAREYGTYPHCARRSCIQMQLWVSLAVCCVSVVASVALYVRSQRRLGNLNRQQIRGE